MIELYDVYDRCKVWVASSQIAEVRDAPYHHGQKCRVTLLGGRTIEASQSAYDVLEAMRKDGGA